MYKTLIFSYLITVAFASPLKCVTNVPTVSDVPDVPTVSDAPTVPILQGEDPARYPSDSSCALGGVFSVNEFGANICEYPAETCPVTKYFSYPDGGNGVELCCNSNSECNYDPVKNYCHPDLKRCVDGSYFGCSEKAGPIFESCL
jgi:hypothetical protein